MKILLINDPGIPVPPKLYGGIERIVYMLAQEYIKQGHEVTLLAGPDSFGANEITTFGENNLPKNKWQAFKEILFVWQYLLLNYKKYDLIHSFGRLIYLLPVLNKPVKKIMSYQRAVTAKNIAFITGFPNKNLFFTGCSNYTVSTGNNAGKWATVYNAVETFKYEFKEKVLSDAPLIFLGRIDRIKGCHHCITLAKEAGRKLIIAGNISTLDHEKTYFNEEIEPHIDGEQIKYIGPVNDEQKNYYLGLSSALLMLIDWDEPFGIVMAEALACGTPVIGFPRGAVPEVVENGTNGFIVRDIEEAKSALNKIDLIDRKKCRAIAEKKFDISVIAREYLHI